jgi:hypothetical protein
MTRAKFPYFRSRAHLMAVSALDCQLCGKGGPSQAAHSNQAIHGKGRSIKASDEYTAALCQSCHTEIDSGHHLTGEQRAQLWDLAYQRTCAALGKTLIDNDTQRGKIAP